MERRCYKAQCFSPRNFITVERAHRGCIVKSRKKSTFHLLRSARVAFVSNIRGYVPNVDNAQSPSAWAIYRCRKYRVPLVYSLFGHLHHPSSVRERMHTGSCNSLARKYSEKIQSPIGHFAPATLLIFCHYSRAARFSCTEYRGYFILRLFVICN